MGLAARTIRDMRRAANSGADTMSRFRLARDQLLYRVLRLVPLPARTRHVRFRGGGEITYRLLRGDILVIREIWTDQSYRLPFGITPRYVIDLGANIGAASAWFAQHHRCDAIVAVEADRENAALLRRNTAPTGVVTVVEAAVGPVDGIALFERGQPHLGRIGPSGQPVDMVSIPTLLEHLPPGARAELVKLDIEGGEEALIMGPLEWLERVDAIVVEFHLAVVDPLPLVARVEAHGFRFIRGGTIPGYNHDVFLRPQLIPEGAMHSPSAGTHGVIS